MTRINERDPLGVRVCQVRSVPSEREMRLIARTVTGPPAHLLLNIVVELERPPCMV
jgi:hypothetical protein